MYVIFSGLKKVSIKINSYPIKSSVIDVAKNVTLFKSWQTKLTLHFIVIFMVSVKERRESYCVTVSFSRYCTLSKLIEPLWQLLFQRDQMEPSEGYLGLIIRPEGYEFTFPCFVMLAATGSLSIPLCTSAVTTLRLGLSWVTKDSKFGFLLATLPTLLAAILFQCKWYNISLLLGGSGPEYQQTIIITPCMHILLNHLPHQLRRQGTFMFSGQGIYFF